MSKHLVLPLVLLVLAACETHVPDSCRVSCTTDADCPGAQSCGELGLCTSGEACGCSAGAFLGCVGEIARSCNAAGNGVDMKMCGAPGCNAEAGRCNSCEAGASLCSADNLGIETCGSDGLWSAPDPCALGCVAATDSVPAHCAYLEPKFLPDICATPAAMPTLDLSASTMIDTGTDATCNGGIVAQTSAPEICVIRYGTISMTSGVVTVRGPRAPAFVADELLTVQGTLDVSADAQLNGPGGGAIVSGARAATALGGGGAGFSVNGADGGSANPSGGGGGAGGAALDPLAMPVRLVGGPRSALPTLQQPGYPASGGGAGAVTLIACRGTVSLAGTIDASGGGGGGGRDTDILPSVTNYAGGAGGGAGGYVVLQGMNVRVIGGVFANGGAGGGGCSTDGCVGNPGADATASTAPARGGLPKDQGGTGGNGGTGSLPTVGLASFISPGGGGGAAGRLQTFTPMTGTVTISSTNSPSFEANRVISTR